MDVEVVFASKVRRDEFPEMDLIEHHLGRPGDEQKMRRQPEDEERGRHPMAPEEEKKRHCSTPGLPPAGVDMPSPRKRRSVAATSPGEMKP